MVAVAAPVADSTKTAGNRAGEKIDWQAVASGGVKGASTNYQVNGTVGQTAAGAGVSASYRMYHGFWQDFGWESCCTLAGDANSNGTVSVGDAVFIISFIFRDGPAPLCRQQADANADGKISAGDAVRIISFIFRDGPAPVCG
jgi:hypothetical protein